MEPARHDKPPLGLHVQFGRFACVAACSFGVDFLCYSFLTVLCSVHPLAANLVSRPLGGLVSYTLNRLWTFQNRSQATSHVQFMRYVLVWIAAFALSELLIAFLHDGIGLSPIPTKLINDGVIGILIFTAHRLFTFR